MEIIEINPKVSIIIPVYNAEKYLSRCLNSVLKQTYSNIEIILVDDGSEDKSSYLCDRYAMLDSRIKVYHKSNEGVSIARNYGIENCNGEYIVFVDSDDYLISECIETLVKLVRNEEEPVLGCVDYYENQNGKLSTYSCEDGKIDSLGYDEGLIKIFNPSSYRGYLWNKIFRLSEIRKYEIRFLPGVKIWEDTLFLMEYIINSSAKILYKHTPLYVYSIYSDSTMGKMDHSKHLTMMKCTNKLLNNLLLPEELYKIIVKLHAELLFEAAIFGTGSVKNESKKEIKNYRKYLDKKKRCVYRVYALCPCIVELIMKRRNELK